MDRDLAIWRLGQPNEFQGVNWCVVVFFQYRAPLTPGKKTVSHFSPGAGDSGPRDQDSEHTNKRGPRVPEQNARDGTIRKTPVYSHHRRTWEIRWIFT